MNTDFEKTADPVLSELTAIKRLLAFALIRSGASQADVGKALGVAQSTVSKMWGSSDGEKPRKSAK